ncbi:MAG: hypothetical protein ACXWT0_00330 [Methylobacter sp.]
MATITALVSAFETNERPAGNILDTTVLTALAIKAVNYYSGFGALAAHLAIPIADPAPDPPTPYPDVTASTDVTVSEWALIGPLFLLYVERENAIQLEASRDMGIDPFGRSSSEVAGDIVNMELDFPHKAFQRDILTV